MLLKREEKTIDKIDQRKRKPVHPAAVEKRRQDVQVDLDQS